MNSFFNIFGNKAPKNCKVDLENETDVVDENGFVWVNDETEYVGCRSERSTVSEKISKERVENFQKEVPSNRSEDLSCNNQDAGLLRPAQLSLSNVNDIPMTLSYPFKTIHMSANHHKYLNLDLYQYDFKTELSILNDKLS